ncbi:hypothetical protein QBC40DRAFT_181773, partial [Triangularia verruculosa]
CRRGRMVCTGEKPICTKCRTAGMVCPGYADNKPLGYLPDLASRSGNKHGLLLHMQRVPALVASVTDVGSES